MSTPYSNDDIEDEGGVVDEDEADGAAIVVVFGTIICSRTAGRMEGELLNKLGGKFPARSRPS